MNRVKKRISWLPEEKTPLLKWSEIHTVCEESRCPNRLECSRSNTATFLIGGKNCTRNCRFCHVGHGFEKLTEEILLQERDAIIKAVSQMKLNYVVITSVTRDDCPEILASHFNQITNDLKSINCTVELLIPDFNADEKYLKSLIHSAPAVIAHNIETVEKLSKKIRPQASYKKSLQVLQYYTRYKPKIIIKSGFMVGLGENLEGICNTLDDLKKFGADIVTIGQYMRPSVKEIEVKKVYSEKEFEEIQNIAAEKGFKEIIATPFVRSSYRAKETWEKLQYNKDGH